jgi:hypothetical protein
MKSRRRASFAEFFWRSTPFFQNRDFGRVPRVKRGGRAFVNRAEDCRGTGFNPSRKRSCNAVLRRQQNLDPVAGEIAGIEGENPADPMHVHRGD